MAIRNRDDVINDEDPDCVIKDRDNSSYLISSFVTGISRSQPFHLCGCTGHSQRYCGDAEFPTVLGMKSFDATADCAVDIARMTDSVAPPTASPVKANTGTTSGKPVPVYTVNKILHF